MQFEKFSKKRLNTRQLEKKLGVSRTSIWRWRRAGLLNPIKMGRFLWYDEDEVNRFIEAQRENNTAQSNAA